MEADLYLSEFVSQKSPIGAKPLQTAQIVRIAPISMIFRPIESQQHDLFLKNFSNERIERKAFKKIFAAVVVFGRFR